MEALFDGFKQFALTADVPTVIAIAVLTYLVQISIFVRLGWDHVIVWVPFVFSFVLTPVMSTSAEVHWGDAFYYRAVVYNGAVGLFAWHVVLPQLRKRYPEWFVLTENAKPDEPPVQPPNA